MKRVGLIGYPLGHTMSPIFQQAGFDALGIDARYEVWETPPEQVERRMDSLRGPDCFGANVTVPHKERVAPFLDTISPWAMAAGAVNTIVNRNGRLMGYNTDSHGFLQALRQDAGFDPAGKAVLILGAGGAARGVAVALAYAGVASMAIANRTMGRAVGLAQAVGAQQPNVGVVPWANRSLTATAEHMDLIVNTTTVGMLHSSAEGQSPLPGDAIPPKCLVYDLVYNPRETPLLRAAKAVGARTLDGLPMLVYQGAAAFSLWTGMPAPVDVMRRAAEQAMRARSNGH